MRTGDVRHEAFPAGGRLAPGQLARPCRLDDLPFATTDDLVDGDGIVGQERAIEAIRFGLDIAEPGYNLYAMGAEGVGRRTLTRRFLDEAARARPAPCDWCYVFDFAAPHRPKALALPAGRGAAFRRDMARLVDDLKAGIPAAFEADEYRARRQAIDDELAERQEASIRAVGERAKARGVALVRTPGGLGLAPLKDDDVMPPEAFRALPEEDRRRIETAIEELQHDVEHVLEQLPKWRREAQRKARELDRQAATGVIASLIAELEAEYRALPDVVRYLHAVQEDVLENAPLFQAARDGETSLLGMLSGHAEAGDAQLRRFAVNLLVDHAASTGAPIVDEDHPTHDNLVGRIEHASRLGTLVTDFTMIQAGALHRANGGYLVVDAAALLTQPLAWEALKRALTAREIRTESLAQALGIASTQALEPDPIPLDVKVVLIGPRRLYELLHALEPAFRSSSRWPSTSRTTSSARRTPRSATRGRSRRWPGATGCAR